MVRPLVLAPSFRPASHLSFHDIVACIDSMINEILSALLIRKQMHVKGTICLAERRLMNNEPIRATTNHLEQCNRTKILVQRLRRVLSAALRTGNLHRIRFAKFNKGTEFDRRYLVNDVKMIMLIKIVDHWSDAFQPDAMTPWIEISLVNLLIK